MQHTKTYAIITLKENKKIIKIEFHFLSVILVLIFCASCNTDSEPECTVPDLIQNENGIQELTCTVNGNFWSAYTPLFSPTAMSAGYNSQTKKFSFVARLKLRGNDFSHRCFEKGDTIDQAIRINCYIDNTFRGLINIYPDNFQDYKGHCYEVGLGWMYQLDTTQPHYIEFVRLDTTTRGWAIGTFQFDAIHDKCKDTVRVRDGRFELLL